MNFVPIHIHRWGEGSILLGVISFAVYLILGIASIPSVAAKLSWREWNFIQSVIGYLGLAAGGTHAFLLLVTSLCNDRRLACQEFFPLNPGVALAAWPGRVPTRTCLYCFKTRFVIIIVLPSLPFPSPHYHSISYLSLHFTCLPFPLVNFTTPLNPFPFPTLNPQ